MTPSRPLLFNWNHIQFRVGGAVEGSDSRASAPAFHTYTALSTILVHNSLQIQVSASYWSIVKHNIGHSSIRLVHSSITLVHSSITVVHSPNGRGTSRGAATRARRPLQSIKRQVNHIVAILNHLVAISGMGRTYRDM